MKHFPIALLSLGLAALLASCMPLAAASTPDATTTATMEKQEDLMKAPDFEMQDLTGNTVKLADFTGEKVYLKYWASWCPICLSGLEELNTLAGEDNDFQILTIVAPDYKGEMSKDAFTDWFSSLENTEHITVLFDENAAYTTAAGVRGYPTSEWIDEEGGILKIAPGQMDRDAIQAGFSTQS